MRLEASLAQKPQATSWSSVVRAEMSQEPRSWRTEAPGRKTARKEGRKGFRAGNQALCWPAALSSAVPTLPPVARAHLVSALMGPQAAAPTEGAVSHKLGDSRTEQCRWSLWLWTYCVLCALPSLSPEPLQQPCE